MALARVLGAAHIDGLERLTGGASRETRRFDAIDTDGFVHGLVLRRDPPGRPGAPGAMSREARAVRAGSAARLAVSEVVLDTDDPSWWDPPA